MGGPVAKETVVQACLTGLNSASKFYDELSGGLQLYEAPEWLLQSEIARSLGKKCHYVTVESSVKWILECAESELRGKLPRNKTGRIDIVVWSGGDFPRYLVEVKKGWDSHCVTEDTKRLSSLINRGGSLHRGLVVVYATAAKEETLERRFREIEENSKSLLLGSLKPKRIDLERESSWLWSGAVFEA